ncbi:putative DNA-binding phosphoprotein [Parapoxvirus red deer/HL953]|uniref:Protein OPG079 n=1 Tax=Parapoxvirus red deer/HL953 TaxID=1579460 RepID=A0A0A7MA73_9POXV|nr:putative DNA-binding phosphoprotein [Parapoxvirus red deer/HL953]AIZ77283.1 putative DNA-binding phosphoprotein [Parapoxvirus red deer/HL953]
MKRATSTSSSKNASAGRHASPGAGDDGPPAATGSKKFCENRPLSCTEAVEFAKSLAASQTKAVESVTLTPSQYPSCSNINVCLVDSLASRLVSPLIMVKGEFKIHANKKTDMQRNSSDSGFFARVKMVSASQMLGQMLEAIYQNIRAGTRIPQSLRSFNVENSTDNTFKNGCMYINRMNGALVEFTSDDGTPSHTCPLMREIESLSMRDAQMATLILAPVVFYRSGGEAKVTFALKKVTMTRECSLTVLGLDGESTVVGMSETPAAFSDDQEVRGLGLVDCSGAAACHDDGDDVDSPFNI